MSASIFISYASQDLKVANTLCKALEGRGFKCWISSRDVLPGENFQVSIVRAIRGARMMLLVFTGNSNNSEEMTKELVLASQHRLIVVPLRIEDVTPNEAFTYEFATRQWIDFFADWEAAMDQLSLRIAGAVGATDDAAAAAVAPVSPPPAPPPPAPAPEPVAAVAPVVEAPKPAPSPPPAPEPAKPAAPVAAAAAAATVVAAAATTAKAATPAAQPAAAAKPAAPAAAAAKTPPPSKPAAAGDDAKPAGKGPPIALFVVLGLVIAAVIAAAVAIPVLMHPKPAAPAKPVTNAVTAPVKAPVVGPAVELGPAAQQGVPVNALAPPPPPAATNAAASNAVTAPHVHKPRPAATTTHTRSSESTEVPF